MWQKNTERLKIAMLTNDANAFPTEQTARQKYAKKTLKPRLESEGKTKEEIKMITTRKAQVQEKHYNDHGSGTGPIELASE